MTCPHCYGIGYDASGMSCSCTMPAEPAKIGRRTHAKDPLPASSWRAYLRHLAKWMLIVLGTTLLATLALGVAYA